LAPVCSHVSEKGYSFTVWNRYDEVVFSSETLGEAWDGKYRGREMPEGTYMYKIKAESNGKEILRKGTVLLHFAQ
jgi:gliding motility-associated-like protein